MRFNPRRLTIPFFLALFAASLVGCGGGASSESADAADSTAADSSAADSTSKEKKPRKEKTTSVTAARVVRGELVLPVMAEGTVRARRTTEIRAEVGGRIDRIHVCISVDLPA